MGCGHLQFAVHCLWRSVVGSASHLVRFGQFMSVLSPQAASGQHPSSSILLLLVFLLAARFVMLAV